MWTQIPDEKTLEKTVNALKANGIEAVVVSNAKEAREKALGLLPKGAEVMTMTSITLETTGIADAINSSDKYISVRNQISAMNRDTQSLAMQKLGAAPEWAIGSVHAVTESGEVIIASASGSQLPAYAYGSAHVVWVVGAQKIVKDKKSGLKRIYEYVLQLESKRVQKAYGMPSSSVNKLLIFNKERESRITMILVKENLGF